MIGQKYSYKDFATTRPIGDITVTLPSPPPKKYIDGYGLSKKNQRFTRQIPDNQVFAFWSQEERKEFIEREWKRRTDGYWFFNNGNLEYITGLHYFYLCYWKFPVVEEIELPNGKKGKRKRLWLPTFTDSDRDYFYYWDHCNKDPDCYGMIHITNRRDGKTYRGTCTMYEVISRTPEALGGIQSKTGTDGKKVFRKLIKSWQKLPVFFKPVDTGESNPSKELRFEEPSKRDTKNRRKKYAEVLRSEINFGTAKEEHYDGDGLMFYYGDEVGKTDPAEAKVHDRWDIVKETLSDGSIITGKSLLTTTVEEMEKKGGKYCKIVWDNSDPNNKNDIGQTESGLYKYFKPAYYGFRGDDKGSSDETKSFIDEYGYSNWQEAKEYLERRRQGKTGASLSSQKRKYPFTEAECFIIDNKQSPFDTDRIYSQIEHNEGLSGGFINRGNFEWKVKDREVVFYPSETGRWEIVWMPPDPNNPNKSKRNGVANNVVWEYNKPRPKNTNIVSGVDPFDHKDTTDDRKSDASSHVYLKLNPLDPENTDLFVSQYINRPPTPEMFYEDMIKQCFFYSCEILSENNKIGLINYFRQRGYDKFLMKRPEPTHTAYSKKHQKEFGIPMTGVDAREALVNAITSYVYNNVGRFESEDNREVVYGRMYFQNTLYEWVEFEPDNWTPYDASVSSGLTLLAKNKYIKPKEAAPEQSPQFFREYITRGTQSVLVERK